MDLFQPTLGVHYSDGEQVLAEHSLVTISQAKHQLRTGNTEVGIVEASLAHQWVVITKLPDVRCLWVEGIECAWIRNCLGSGRSMAGSPPRGHGIVHIRQGES